MAEVYPPEPHVALGAGEKGTTTSPLCPVIDIVVEVRPPTLSSQERVVIGCVLTTGLVVVLCGSAVGVECAVAGGSAGCAAAEGCYAAAHGQTVRVSRSCHG